MKKNKRINVLFTLMISTFISIISSISPSNAQEIDSPKPIIKDSKIFPGAQYSSTAIPGTLKLAFGEGIYWYGIRAVLLEVANKNSNCSFGSNVGTEIAQVVKEVAYLNTFPIQSISWTNPADSAGKQICIHVQWRSEATGAGGFKNTYLATTFKDISEMTTSSPSSTVVAEVLNPSGSKPSISGTPVEGSKFKVSIKSWNMNGNDFEGRSVYLELCSDSNCNNVINSYPVVETGTLNFDVAKTLTMPKIVGKAGQFVKVVDSVYYPALASGELREDQFVELSSSIKKIEKVQSSSPSSTPSEVEVVTESTPEVNMEEMAQPTPEVTPVEEVASSSALSMGLILGVLAALVIALLIVIILLVARKKK